MNNLFVCHSQAQLILATGLAYARFTNDTNYLIVFVDFNMNESLRHNLLECFCNKVLFLQGTYPAKYKSWSEKLKRYPHDLKKIRKFMDVPFDRVFEVCDGCIPEMFILKYAATRNKDVEDIWLEDGSYPYFRNIVQGNGFDSNSMTRFIHKIIFKYLCGLGKFYDKDFREMGGNSHIKYAYLTFPGMEREPYHSQRKIRGISHQEYMTGIKTMYDPLHINLCNGAILLVMDKLDVYRQPETVKNTIKTLLKSAESVRVTVYVKFHPREESQWKIFTSCQELNKNIGIESIYSTLLHQNISLKIVGIKSTGLQSAKKLGLSTYSLAEVCGENNPELLTFYSQLNINIIRNTDEIAQILTD